MAKEGISRRKFVIGGLAGLGAIVLLGRKQLADVFLNMIGARETIDPPKGLMFQNPPLIPNLSTTEGVVSVELEAKIAPININGTAVELMTYNGQFPQETIRLKKGDILKVHFKNSFPELEESILGHVNRNVTNLHTHGWHVSPSGNADNILITFNPGATHDYEYDLALQEAGTLSFMHPHAHVTVADQMWHGLAGNALIVEDETDVISGYEEHIMILKDIGLQGNMVDPYTMENYLRGKEGNIVMVNGQVNPVLPIRPGQVQRWRIVNSCSARFFDLSLEDHEIHLVGTDGGLLDKPYPLRHLLLSPGERVDLLVKADKFSGEFKFLSLPYDRGRKTPQKITLLTLSYQGSQANDSLPTTVNPDAKRLEMDLDSLPNKKFELSMGVDVARINRRVFGKNTLSVSSKLGTYEVWEIKNQGNMDHNFHQHVNASQIISIEGGDPEYAALYTTIPAWKDTIIIPRGGSVKMLVPVMDYTGTTVYHCHILEHEDIGMMGLWKIET